MAWKVSRTSILVLIFVSGCAVGVKHDYKLATLDIQAETVDSIAVATLDHRGYVLDARKNDSFVGLSRGGFGNPFDIVTLSGNPLADDISYSIAASLDTSSVRTMVIKIEPSQSVSNAFAKLQAEGAQRSILLTLREWKSDSYFNVGFHYDFDISILDAQGNLLLEKQFIADEDIGVMGPFDTGGGENVTVRFRSLMAELFQDPEVMKHL